MTILSYFTLKSIGVYKSLISPSKGYSCAHRIYFNDISCSTFIQGYIKENGVQGLKSAIQLRKKECEMAFTFLNRKKKPDNLNNNGKKKNASSCNQGDAACCQLPFDLINF